MGTRVLVATPAYQFHDYCLGLYADAVRAIEHPAFDVLLVDNSETGTYLPKIRAAGLEAVRVPRDAPARTVLARCRNTIRRITLEGGYDYLLFLDQDVFAPPDVLTRLLAHRMPVVSGLYTKWALGRRWAIAACREWLPVRWSESSAPGPPAGLTPLADLPENSTIEVYGSGHGCLLVARNVLEQLRFWYDPAYDNDSDLYFSLDVRAMGWRYYLDTSVRCGHFSLPKDYLAWKRSRQW